MEIRVEWLIDQIVIAEVMDRDVAQKLIASIAGSGETIPQDMAVALLRQLGPKAASILEQVLIVNQEQQSEVGGGESEDLADLWSTPPSQTESAITVSIPGLSELKLQADKADQQTLEFIAQTLKGLRDRQTLIDDLNAKVRAVTQEQMGQLAVLPHLATAQTGRVISDVGAALTFAPDINGLGGISSQYMAQVYASKRNPYGIVNWIIVVVLGLGISAALIGSISNSQQPVVQEQHNAQ